MRYRFVGLHTEDLASGQPLGPGDYVELDDEDFEDAHNKRFLDEGLLIEAPKSKAEQAQLARPRNNASRETWDSFATALGVDPNEHDTREGLISAVDKELEGRNT